MRPGPPGRRRQSIQSRQAGQYRRPRQHYQQGTPGRGELRAVQQADNRLMQQEQQSIPPNSRHDRQQGKAAGQTPQHRPVSPEPLPAVFRLHPIRQGPERQYGGVNHIAGRPVQTHLRRAGQSRQQQGVGLGMQSLDRGTAKGGQLKAPNVPGRPYRPRTQQARDAGRPGKNRRQQQQSAAQDGGLDHRGQGYRQQSAAGQAHSQQRDYPGQGAGGHYAEPPAQAVGQAQHRHTLPGHRRQNAGKAVNQQYRPIGGVDPIQPAGGHHGQ